MHPGPRGVLPQATLTLGPRALLLAAQVLDAIATVGGRAGVLLIVKNYTGDRLSFGLAATRAKVR